MLVVLIRLEVLGVEQLARKGLDAVVPHNTHDPL